MGKRLGELATYDAEANLSKRTDQYEDHELPKNIGKKKKRKPKGKLRGQARLDEVMGELAKTRRNARK